LLSQNQTSINQPIPSHPKFAREFGSSIVDFEGNILSKPSSGNFGIEPEIHECSHNEVRDTNLGNVAPNKEKYGCCFSNRGAAIGSITFPVFHGELRWVNLTSSGRSQPETYG